MGGAGGHEQKGGRGVRGGGASYTVYLQDSAGHYKKERGQYMYTFIPPVISLSMAVKKLMYSFVALNVLRKPYAKTNNN